jgi:pyruvate,water dikinase
MYVYGYGLFRPFFLRLADQMVDRGWLKAREDIFYLDWQEIQKCLDKPDPEELWRKVNKRKDEMDAYSSVLLPDIIYGENPPPVSSISTNRLIGTPTSQGYYSGSIKVVRGRDDFGKVESGDIIVIPYSDVGWTPIFARAGAVVAESGGLLSHSSIIAREYHIPAIVSVPNCMHLTDGQKASVNGFSGEVELIDES